MIVIEFGRQGRSRVTPQVRRRVVLTGAHFVGTGGRGRVGGGPGHGGKLAAGIVRDVDVGRSTVVGGDC